MISKTIEYQRFVVCSRFSHNELRLQLCGISVVVTICGVICRDFLLGCNAKYVQSYHTNMRKNNKKNICFDCIQYVIHFVDLIS